jgi:hypothetical protein
MAIQDEIDKGVLFALESLNPDLDSLYEETHQLNMDEYIEGQQIGAGALGAGTAAIPGMHLAGMAADIVTLFKLMCNTSYGIGSIVSNQKQIGRTGIDEFDFIIILTKWGGDTEAVNAVNVAVASAKTAGVAVGGHIVAHTAMTLLPQPVMKLLVKIVAKKIGLKFTSKGFFGFIPGVGAAASAVINLWIFNSMMEQAKSHFSSKVATIPVGVTA